MARDLAMFWYARRYKFIVIAWGLRGRWLLIALEGILNRQRVIIIEFAPHAVFGSWTRRVLVQLRNSTIMKVFLRRALRLGHVLSKAEVDIYSQNFNLTSEQLFYLPWAQTRSQSAIAPTFCVSRSKRMVVSSGRMFCDWDTVIAAAQGMDWELHLVCGRNEYKRLSKKCAGKSIRLLSEISMEEHQALLANASVYVISLKEAFVSSGQRRVANAIEAGVPIVATDVVGLKGYLEDEHNALLVPPSNSQAIREAVQSVLGDPIAARKRAMQAWSDAQPNTPTHYQARLREAIIGCLN